MRYSVLHFWNGRKTNFLELTDVSIFSNFLEVLTAHYGFKHSSEVRVTYNKSVTIEELVDCVTKCMLECGREQKCLSFLYNTKEHNCSLFNHIRERLQPESYDKWTIFYEKLDNSRSNLTNIFFT